MFQLAQDKKGKAAEKSPQEEIAPASAIQGTKSIHEQIVEQGNRIRELKTAKAAKVMHSMFLLVFLNQRTT